MIEGLIKLKFDSIKQLCYEIDELVKDNNLVNEQWFINCLDELNKFSVKW